MHARGLDMGAPTQLLIFGGCALLLLGRQNKLHRPHAVKIVIPIDGPGEMWFPRHERRVSFCEPLLIAPDIEHVMASSTRRLTLFVDPETRGRALSRHLDGAMTGPIPRALRELAMEGARRWAQDLDTEGAGSERARTHVDQLLAPAAWPTPRPIDPRVLQVAALIVRDQQHRHDSARASSTTRLSSRWLARIFRAQTGIGIRGYAQWVKLGESVQRACSSRSLTDAALAGGFADMAHFTRTMQTRLGLVPSQAPFAGARVVESFFSPVLSQAFGAPLASASESSGLGISA